MRPFTLPIVALLLLTATPARAQQPLARIDAALDAERWADAAALLDTALAANPRDVQLLQRRGRARRELGELDAALADYTAAVTIAPSLATAWAGRAATQVRRAQPDSALADLARARAAGLADPQLDFIEGLAQLDRRQPEAAYDAFARVTAAAPAMTAAWYYQGLAAGRSGRHSLAEQHLTQAIERGMPGPAAWSARAEARRNLQDMPGACADAKEAVARGNAELAATVAQRCP